MPKKKKRRMAIVSYSLGGALWFRSRKIKPNKLAPKQQGYDSIAKTNKKTSYM
jgi:hypothetical protein